jgi:NADH-quinone oxidoreductase subunit J
MEKILFYILSAVILGFGWLSVTTRNLFRAAVYLLFVLLAIAGLYFLIEYNFLAAVQLTVYAGGVVVLIIFSILLTYKIDSKLPAPSRNRIMLSILLCLAGAGTFLGAIRTHDFIPIAKVDSPSIEVIGKQLLSTGQGGYVLPFEVISILLLAAMVGAIAIAKGRKVKANKQD